MINLCRARYSVAGRNIPIGGYLSMYILLPLSTRLVIYGEKVITYLEDVG